MNSWGIRCRQEVSRLPSHRIRSLAKLSRHLADRKEQNESKDHIGGKENKNRSMIAAD